jgi:hypothetical protein
LLFACLVGLLPEVFAIAEFFGGVAVGFETWLDLGVVGGVPDKDAPGFHLLIKSFVAHNL